MGKTGHVCAKMEQNCSDDVIHKQIMEGHKASIVVAMENMAQPGVLTHSVSGVSWIMAQFVTEEIWNNRLSVAESISVCSRTCCKQSSRSAES